MIKWMFNIFICSGVVRVSVGTNPKCMTVGVDVTVNTNWCRGFFVKIL